mgnify:CR=1 FL=1
MKSDWVSAPDMWEWQKYSRLNGVSLTHPMRLMRPGSFFDGEILPMWLEGVATLFVLTRFAGHSPAFAEKYWQIYEYIGSHPEAQKIYAAVETKSPLHYT